MGGSSVKAECLPLCLLTELVWALCTWQLASDCSTSLGSPWHRGYSHCGRLKIMQSNAGGIFKVTSRCNSGNFEKVSVVVCKMAINTFLPCVLAFATLPIKKYIFLLLDSGFDYVTRFDHCNISKHDTSRDLKSTGTLRYTYQLLLHWIHENTMKKSPKPDNLLITRHVIEAHPRPTTYLAQMRPEKNRPAEPSPNF